MIGQKNYYQRNAGALLNRIRLIDHDKEAK